MKALREKHTYLHIRLLHEGDLLRVNPELITRDAVGVTLAGKEGFFTFWPWSAVRKIETIYDY